MEIVTREEALAQGLVRYFTGEPCPKGHVCERRTKSWKCIDCIKEYKNEKYRTDLEYREKHHKRTARRKKELRETNPEYRAKHNADVNQRMKTLKDRDPTFRKRRNAYYKIRRDTNVSAKIAGSLRVLINKFVKNGARVGSATKDLGCSLDELKHYIEHQFTDAMSWENYGSVWEIDHKTPLSRLDLTDREQFLKACYFTNLQPLLVSDNRSKKAKSMEEWTGTRSSTP